MNKSEKQYTVNSLYTLINAKTREGVVKTMRSFISQELEAGTISHNDISIRSDIFDMIGSRSSLPVDQIFECEAYDSYLDGFKEHKERCKVNRVKLIVMAKKIEDGLFLGEIKDSGLSIIESFTREADILTSNGTNV